MSFVSSVEGWFSRLFGATKKASTWMTIGKSTLLVVGPLVQTAVLLIEPEAEPAVAAIITKIQVGLSAAGAVLDGAGPTANLPSILDSVKSNLGQLEQAFQVKNPDSQARITGITNTVIGELNAILALIPPSSSAPTSPAATSAQGTAVQK